MVLLLALASGLPAQGQTRMPDSTLYTVYSAIQPTQIQFSVCGSLPQTEGCYGGGMLGPFTNACSIVQSVPVAINAVTVARYIYVLDSGSGGASVTLTAYKRTDVISQTFDTITLTEITTVPLPTLVGGTAVNCMLAQNPTGVYAGTSLSPAGVVVNKSTYAVTPMFAYSGYITAITADSYGYVTVNQTNEGTNVNTVFGPNGQFESDGGGAYFMINPIDGVVPANYPFNLNSPMSKMGWHYK